MTTYDDIYTEFMTIYKTENINLPQTNEGRYNLIKSAVKHFNSIMQMKIQCNDITETISEDLSENHLIIIAHCIKHTSLENELTFYITAYKPFTKEIGLQHYNADIKALEGAIEREQRNINQLIENDKEDYI